MKAIAVINIHIVTVKYRRSCKVGAKQYLIQFNYYNFNCHSFHTRFMYVQPNAYLFEQSRYVLHSVSFGFFRFGGGAHTRAARATFCSPSISDLYRMHVVFNFISLLFCLR